MSYCGKCFQNRGEIRELSEITHFPFSLLPKREKREHSKCPSRILHCSFCQAERTEGKTFDIVHLVRRLVKGQMVDEFVTRSYRQVLDEIPVARAAAA